MVSSLRIVIVGGGVIGCGIAYELAQRGVAASVVDRGPIGGEASWASAGIVSYPGPPTMAPDRVELTRRSLDRYPALVDELEARTGIAIEYRRTGVLTVAVEERQAAIEQERVAFQIELGYPVETLTDAVARSLEPALPPALAAVWWSPGGGSLSAHRLTLALAEVARQHGATLLPHTPVVRLLDEKGRIAGVRLLDRDLPAEIVILAAGAWTRLIGEGLATPLPTKPVKGQLIAFGNVTSRPTHVIAGHGGYVRPRVDGTTLVAATEEDAGFDRRVTGHGLAWLLDLTRTLCPGLLDGEVVQSWSGLRPGTDGGEPLIGPVPGREGLWVAAGHFRTGIKEAPATAEVVAESIVSGRLDPLLAAFAPPASGR